MILEIQVSVIHTLSIIHTISIQESGLPISMSRKMLRACIGVLKKLLGNTGYKQYR